MLLIITVTNSFDGSTPAPATATLEQLEPDVYHLKDNGADLADVGVLPWDLIAAVINSKTGRISYFSHDGGAAATHGAARLLVAGQEITNRVWDPQATRSVRGFPVLSGSYAVTIRSDTFGAQAFALEIFDATPDVLDPQSLAEAYAVDLPAPPPTVTDIKTANYTAAACQTIPYDTTGGAFTITLPADPQTCNWVRVKEVADSAFNDVTIDGNGANVEAVAGGFVTSTTYGVGSGYAEWIYDGGRWLLINVR